MIFEFADYRAYLKTVLKDRSKRNPSYSLRAMARSFEVAPSLLSAVLSGKKNFSYERTISVSQKLKLRSREAEYFSLLVQRESAASDSAKEEIASRLKKYLPRKMDKKLDADHFEGISEWYHIPIVELADIYPNLTPALISKKLEISAVEAEAALGRLFRLGLLVRGEQGEVTRGQGSFLVRSERRAEAIAQFHKRMHQKAAAALDELPVREQWIGTETYALDPAQIPEMNEAIEEFLSRMVEISKRSKKKSVVYHLLLHHFSLTPNVEDSK